MAKQIKRLLALLVASVMCFSLICMPSYALEEEQKYNFDFETNDPTAYFASIPGWNMSGTKDQFTIHTWEDENADVWGKSLKYTNGPANEQMRIGLGGSYDVVGYDFSFRFDSVSNNVNLSFRQNAGDLYVLTLGASRSISFLGRDVASYEAGVWYDISVVFSNSKKYGKLKFKEHDSDVWQEFEGTYSGTNAVATEGLFFDIYGGAQDDGGEKFFDNMRVYIPGFEIEDIYVESGDVLSADIDETVVFKYTNLIEDEIDPIVVITKDGEEIDPAYEVSAQGNKIQIDFEELERGANYNVSLSGIKSFLGDSAPAGEIEFTTADYTVDVESISVSDGTVYANLKGAYKNGVEAYIAASAYDSDDNLVDVDILPIEVPYREADVIEFTPDFDGDYSYIKAMVVRNFESAISYSKNAPSYFEPEPAGDGEYEAIKSVESDETTITVCGDNISENDSIITIQYLENGKTWSELSDFDCENGDITEILSGFDAVSDVGYGEGYVFTKKIADGVVPAFRVRFGSGSVVYYDPVFIANVNAAQGPEELSEIVKGFSPVWDEIGAIVEVLTEGEEELFWNKLAEIKDFLADEGTAIEFPSQVIELAPGISALARLNNAAGIDRTLEIFDSLANDGIFKTNSYDIYAGTGDFEGFGMSDSQKFSLAEHIMSNKDEYVYVEDFTSDFDANVVLYAVKGGSKARIDKILTGSDLVDSDEFPTYATLKEAKKKVVCEEIGTSKLFTSIEALEDAVEAESKAAKKANQGSGGSGGGGGGGGSASSEIKGQPFVSVGEEDKEEVKELTFDDIKNVDWAQKAINELSKKGIVNGDGKGNFRPNDFVTREEFIKMLVLTLNISVSSADENFDDIDASDWCQPYVAAANAKGIVNGIDDNTFGKGRIITREEMATMTYRALSVMGIMLGGVAKDEFADVDAISDWAKDACVKMQEAGIINGMGDNHFAPKENVTRAQAAKILYEVLSR